MTPGAGAERQPWLAAALLEAMISFADRAVARQHLELAERRVAEGQQRVTTQLALVARLERHGHDTREAVNLLHQLEAILALQVQARDCLRQLNEGYTSFTSLH